MILIEKIRAATRNAHEELDAAMMPCIKRIHTVADYINLLTAFYGFFRPVYEQIDAHLQTTLLPDYTTRRKPADILQNLSILQYHDPITASSTSLPRITNTAGAFGALYVMEGSTLGGLMIKKMIAAQTGLTDGQLSFFAGYGKQTRERWTLFIETLNKAAIHSSDEEAAVQCASETFACFADWLRKIYF